MNRLQGVLVVATMLGSVQAFADEKATSPYDIDLTPSPPVVEKAAAQNLNPDISFIGDFLAGNSAALYQSDQPLHRPVYLREVEIDGVGYVSPYAKALFVASFTEEEAGIEEGYMNFFKLPASMNLRLGKMLVDTDTLNPLHQHALPFVDRPLAWQHAFGTEGLHTVGANLSIVVPNPWDHYILLSGTYGVNDNDQANTSALFGGNHQSMLYNLRGSTSWDLGQYLYLNLNADGLFAPLPDGSVSHVYIAELELRYSRDPVSNAITFLNGLMWNRGNPFQTAAFSTQGFYNYLGWQFSPRWRIGARYDHSDNETFLGEERQLSGMLSFYPTETNYLRLQYAQHQMGGVWENKVWFQVDFMIGPHQLHTAL